MTSSFEDKEEVCGLEREEGVAPSQVEHLMFLKVIHHQILYKR
jgi:hypothetical protein